MNKYGSWSHIASAVSERRVQYTDADVPQIALITDGQIKTRMASTMISLAITLTSAHLARTEISVFEFALSQHLQPHQRP